MSNLYEFFNAAYQGFYTALITADRWQLYLKALGITLRMTAGAILIGTVIGIFLALMRISKVKIFNIISNIYIDFIRGTPTIVQLMFIYFVIFATLPVDRVIVATLAFGINSGAYIAEIIRAGIMAVDKGQMEAGRSLGLNYTKTMIFIIMPQAIKNILPAYTNEFVVLVKETSVASMIGIVDLTKIGEQQRTATYEPFFPLIIIALLYYIVTKTLSVIFARLERRLRESDIR